MYMTQGRASAELKGVAVETSVVHGGGHYVLEVKMGGGKALAPAREGRVCYVILIDKSKSMGEFNKLGTALDAAVQLLQYMAPDDLIAVAVFDEKVKYVIPLMEVEKARRRAEKIRHVKPGTYTLMYEALTDVVNTLMKQKGIESYIKRVVLISDGEPWPTYTEKAYYERFGKMARRVGIAITTIGVGPDYGREIMYTLASASGGAWYHLDEISDLSEVLRADVSHAKKVLLRGVKIEVKPEGGTIKEAYLLRRHPQRLDTGGVYEVGDIAAGETVVLTAALDAPGGTSVKIRVSDAEGGTVEEALTLPKEEQFSSETEVGDATRLLTLAREGAKLLENPDEVNIEILEEVANTAVLPQIREQARKIIEAARERDHRSVAEATDMTIVVQDVTKIVPEEGAQIPPPSSDKPKAVLVLLGEVGRLEVSQPYRRVGRQDLAGVVPDDALRYITRRCGPEDDVKCEKEREQFVVVYRDGRYYIYDRGSTGGTWLNGNRVGPEGAEIRDGDEILIGRSVRLKVKYEV